MRSIPKDKLKDFRKNKQIVDREGKITKPPVKIEPLDKLTAQVKSLVVAMSKPQQQVITAPDVQVNVPTQSPPVVNIEQANHWDVIVTQRDRTGRIEKITLDRRKDNDS